MRDGSKAGVAAAIDLAGGRDSLREAEDARALAAGVQLPLLDDEVALEARMPLREPPGASGPKGGRPKGARNRSTRAVSEYLLERYGCPVEGALRVAMRPLGDLVAELVAIQRANPSVKLLSKGQSLLDIARFQQACREAAAPYVRQRQPMAVEIDQRAQRVLIIGQPTAPQLDQVESRFSLSRDMLVKAVQDQRVNASGADGAGAKSHETASHDDVQDAEIVEQ